VTSTFLSGAQTDRKPTLQPYHINVPEEIVFEHILVHVTLVYFNSVDIL
jgi:hypothetical protein